MIRQNYLKITEENNNKNEDKFKFLGQFVISQCWFDLGFIVFRKILAQVNLISIRKYIKGIMKHKIQIHLKCLYLQS